METSERRRPTYVPPTPSTPASTRTEETSDSTPGRSGSFTPPAISLPRGGGAIRGIGEKFAANPVTGSGSMTVSIATSPARSRFGPELTLSYDSGSGNGPFGFGWSLSLASITRKTDKGLPQYRDAEESDVFILSGAEDLVPLLVQQGDGWVPEPVPPRTVNGRTYDIKRYRPRVEALFARIERWTNQQDASDSYWRSISRDNVTTWYGKTDQSRIFDPADPTRTRIYSWLICESYDDKGNAIVYTYVPENDVKVDRTEANERNRSRTANRYLKRIEYGNRTSRLIQPDLSLTEWMFEVVFDYDEGHYEDLPLNPAIAQDAQHRFAVSAARLAPGPTPWAARPDPFSFNRPGFEVRTHRRCRCVLMYHRFPDLGPEPCLVRSTEFDYRDFDYTGFDPSTPADVAAEHAHDGSTRRASFIRAVTQSGFVRDAATAPFVRNGATYVTYLKKSLPAVEFDYSRATIQQDIRDVDPESLENLPAGVDGSLYQFVDLDGEGVSGILARQREAWFYKPALGDARFGPVQVVTTRPAVGVAGQQLLDLAGDGQLDLVALSGSTPGFYERTFEEQWSLFKPFASLPDIAWNDPNLRFVDLNGDGLADVLATEQDAFVWYQSLAESGFAPSQRTFQSFDEEQGPRLVFADGMQSIYLADMSGDGLSDLVRICNREVSYWPNLGYGRFGKKVTMDDAPWFDNPDQFDYQRLRLADIDGSGTSDIIYLGRDGARLYFNQSGNRWSGPHRLDQFPLPDDVSSVTATDLLGNGTACLVWSSPLPGAAPRRMRFIDLMGGQKPHLLVTAVNNLGAETRVRYASSTKFYLADKAAGAPWITRLPFPVHVVERVETYDRVSRNRFVTRSAYHHGYFDGVEREFRGFGMVEQFDTEELAALSASGDFPVGDNIDVSSHVPPVHTKTWFHTGVYLGRDRVSNFFAGLTDAHDRGEYYREPAWIDDDIETRRRLLDDTVLPAGLTIDEEREACRALKGMMLRREVYARDGTARAAHPYTVTEQNYTIRLLQGRGDNRHAAFFTHAREAINYYYERNPNDPRVAHALTLEVDRFGNVLKEAAVGYGRRTPDMSLSPPDRAIQTRILATYTENRVTNPIEADADDYRTPLPCETITFEVTGLTLPPGRLRFTHAEMLTAGTGAAGIAYEQNPTPGVVEKRVVEQVRTLYRRNDLTGPSAFTFVESLALPYERYKLAFTPGLVTQVYGARVTTSMLDGDGRYVHSEGDANWWLPSGRLFYSPGSGDTPAQELTFARQHFFIPRRYRDPFHTNAVSTESFIDYDVFDLLMLETRDALGNRTTVGERDAAGTLLASGADYRVLQPRLVMDPNRNRTAVALDALGMVAGTAVMGKPAPAAVEGDSLSGFDPELTNAVIVDHLANPLANPQALLQHATTRLVYDLFAYQRTKAQPNPQSIVVYTLARETHDSDPVPAGGLAIQHGFSYSDGFGREIQKKVQAEPGPVPMRAGDGSIIVGVGGQPTMTATDVSPRWVGSGWTVFNNKGKPVRQYEPFFTDRHAFEFDVRIGVSRVVFYDPIERVVATLHPNHTWEKVLIDQWRQQTWDPNDTVLVGDPRTDADVGDFFRRLPVAAFLPTWHVQRDGGALGPHEQDAARKAAIHRETPTVAHADSLGRTFLTVARNRFKYSDTPPAAPPVEELHTTRVAVDIEGNQRQIVDALNRIVIRYDYDMLGTRIHHASMDAGERWTLRDVTGKPIYAFDSRNHRFRKVYDQLRRMTDSFVREGAGAEVQIGRIVYGESQVDPEATNLRGRAVQTFDQAGVVISDQYDFKGNALRNQRQLAVAYNATLDWSAAVPLDATIYTSRTRYDALNRPAELTAPDNTTIRPAYNQANLLERIEANVRGAAASTPFVADIDYDAKGQRTSIDYGNGVRTTYEYDPLTFRIVRLFTRRDAATFPDDCPQTPPAGWPGCAVQNIRYTYDPVGNITRIRDDAQQTRYFLNKRVDPNGDYTYDAVYRLIEATGREHLGQVGDPPTPAGYIDKPRVGIVLAASDGNAVGRYLQRYVYDVIGNLQQMIHRGTDPVHPGWTRTYAYQETSQLDPGVFSNRLTSTTIGATTEAYSAGGNGYDVHGNLLRMPQLEVLQWDVQDQLQMTRRQAVNAGDEEGVARQGERTWYVYDGRGERVRKVTELATGQVKDERIYLGGFEIYRRQGVSPLVRETLHVMDGRHRIALVETRTQGAEAGVPAQLVRYQFVNHLGSASLELDDQAQIVSYEEYTPYGSTSFQAVRGASETPKRYRCTGKERDEESGFYYHGARYYAPWVGRWISCDPAGLVNGTNLYKYASDNPVRLHDPSGLQDENAPLLLPMPSLLDPRTAEERMLGRLAGTLIPPLRLGPPPDLTVPGTFTFGPSFASPTPSTGSTPAGGGTGGTPPASPDPAPASTGGGIPAPSFSGQLFLPRLQIDWGPTRLVADTSSASFRVGSDRTSVMARYAYGGDISLSSRGPDGSGTVSVNPSTGLTTFRVEGTFPGGTTRTSVNTEGAFGFGFTARGFSADVGYSPLQDRFNLSLSFGGRPAPIYSPGLTSTLLPDLGSTFTGGVAAGTNLLRGTPDVLSDPLTLPAFIGAHSTDIGAVSRAVDAGTAIYDIPRRPHGVDVRFRLNLSIAPASPPNPATVTPPASSPPPPGGVTFTGVLQITPF
jgi:RHS repeat-associated protein